ncbi:MAG: hypothetical protein KJO63_12480 [Maribacter sp.]|nr:hypothetical protein [Maribacter sp.]
MFLFFKNLRRRLLANKKFGKYLLYAVGEVLIVIIGILVAVEVNNSNERQQEKETQIELLKGIKAELEFDLNNLSSDLGVHEGQVRSSQVIIDHLENNLPYHDSLAKHFLDSGACTILLLNKGGYETLKSLGVGIITNIDLRKQIIYLYDGHYSFLGNLWKDLYSIFQHGETSIWNSRFEEAENLEIELGEHWEGEGAIGGMIPLDFDALRNDRQYLYYLKTTKNKHKIYIFFLEEAKAKISEAVLGIEEELNVLEE